jgi:transposase
MNSAPVVGIDVSKNKLDVALLVGGKVKSKVVANSSAGHQQLVDWLVKSKAVLDELHVCMEATGVYYEPVACTLHATGIKVSVVNPGCIKGFAHSENLRNKNDTVDAGLIARYCAAMTPALCGHRHRWNSANYVPGRFGFSLLKISASKRAIAWKRMPSLE